MNFGNKIGRLKSALVNLITFTKRTKTKVINNKKYGIIDIGSNSVRAILCQGGKILYKNTLTTRLGEGLAQSGVIGQGGFDRSLSAITKLFYILINEGADEIFSFATEAVRSAKNGKDFTLAVKNAVGMEVDVVSGDGEGDLGLLGALNGKDGGVIDIGGASAEISVAKGSEIIYSHSLPLGAVRLYDWCGEEEEKLDEVIEKSIDEYGKVPQYVDYYAIGGTATTIGFIDAGIEKYDENIVDGRVITLERLGEIYQKLRSLSVEERVKKLHINPKRAEIIVGGVYLLKKIMLKFGINEVTVSEGDNLIGYYKKKICGEGYVKKS